MAERFTVEWFREQVEAIRVAAYEERDFEKAHGIEDELRYQALVMANRCEADAAEIAGIALESSAWNFPRFAA